MSFAPRVRGTRVTRTTGTTRAVAALAALTLLAGGTAACGAGGGAGGDKELTYWSMWKQGEDQQKVLAAAFKEFTAETGIEVNVQWSGREVLSQVVPRLNAGNPPDLVDQGGTALQSTLGPSNGLQGLGDVYEKKIDGEQGTVREAIPEALTEDYQVKGGEPFLVPYEVVGSTMWFNAKVDPELREDPPQTWEDLMAVMKKLKGEGRTPVAIDGDIEDYAGYWLVWSLLRAGGPGTLSEAALDKTGAAFDSQAWQDATEAVQQMIDGGYIVEDFDGTKFPTQQSAWAEQSSRTNLLLMGTWAASETTASLTKSGKDPATAIDYGTFPFPAVGANEGAKAAEAVPIGFAVPAKARNADAAKKFMAFFTGTKWQSRIAKDTKNLSPRKDVEPPAELAGYSEEFNNAPAYTQASDGLPVKAPKWESDVWRPTLGEFFAGKLDAAAFRAKLKQKTVALNKNGG